MSGGWGLLHFDVCKPNASNRLSLSKDGILQAWTKLALGRRDGGNFHIILWVWKEVRMSGVGGVSLLSAKQYCVGMPSSSNRLLGISHVIFGRF